MGATTPGLAKGSTSLPTLSAPICTQQSGGHITIKGRSILLSSEGGEGALPPEGQVGHLSLCL